MGGLPGGARASLVTGVLEELLPRARRSWAMIPLSKGLITRRACVVKDCYSGELLLLLPDLSLVSRQPIGFPRTELPYSRGSDVAPRRITPPAVTGPTAHRPSG